MSLDFRGDDVGAAGQALFFAAKWDEEGGCAIAPFANGREGSTLFLPHRVDRIYAFVVRANGTLKLWRRTWMRTKWSDPLPVESEFFGQADGGLLRMTVRAPQGILRRWKGAFSSESASRDRPLVWAKDLAENDGWGALLPFGAARDERIRGDFALPCPGSFAAAESDRERVRLTWSDARRKRVVIYQLLVRLFGNTNETRKLNGTIDENGCGKFEDLSERALAALRDELGVTHLWLTGVLAQASGTDYREIGKPADDANLLKGLAGSPYAIKDCADVCPDYAIDPADRMKEFKALLERIHGAGLKAIIDFVGNHVARSHDSALVEFGKNDDRSVFFAPNNNFFWLRADSPGGGPPLRLPTAGPHRRLNSACEVSGMCDGLFEPERVHGRVTGNNAVTWAPSANDWYETVKLNYGFDFITGRRCYPHGDEPDWPVPDTWWKMDAVLAHWQELGVDGFRCDMAHLIPPEFWAWAIDRARRRRADVFFAAEAYHDDPMRVESGDAFTRGFGDVGIELLNAGFDTVYHSPPYKALKRVHDGPAWANDLDGAMGVRNGRVERDYVFDRALHYAENHDEVRLAAKHEWGGLGMEVGRPVSAVLFALSRGAVLLYSGQEVGEPADGAEGFGGDDARTTIFDYWCMPEFAKWVNGHRYDGARLSLEQQALRRFYGRLVALLKRPALKDGDFFPLNGENLGNPKFGRLEGEHTSGHWIFAFARVDPATGEFALAVANLHARQRTASMEIALPGTILQAICARGAPVLRDELSGLADVVLDPAMQVLRMESLPPLSAGIWFGSAGRDGDQAA